MYDLIKNICDENSWKFYYARKDFSNLFDEEDSGDWDNNDWDNNDFIIRTPVVFLDPVQITESFNEMNVLESKNYSGTMMILYSSDLNEEDYDFRYQNYIKPIVDSTLQLVKESIQCDGEYSIINWRTTEVINAFDWNGDGVIVNYSINE